MAVLTASQAKFEFPSAVILTSGVAEPELQETLRAPGTVPWLQLGMITNAVAEEGSIFDVRLLPAAEFAFETSKNRTLLIDLPGIYLMPTRSEC